MLGATEIGETHVPMPREGTPSASQTYARDRATGSYVHGTTSGVLDDGTPVVVKSSSDSKALTWVVMGLAAIILVYAGFLVSQLLTPPAPKRQPPPAPIADTKSRVEEPPKRAPRPKPKDEARAEEAPAVTPTPASAEPETRVVAEPERPSSPARSRRRRARPKPQAAVTRAAEPEKPTRKEPATEPTPAPRPEPVDIDIRNPYRN